MMVQGNLPTNNFELWRSLRSAEMDYCRARWGFFSHSTDKQLTIRQALKSPSDRTTTVRILL
ncbi:hypothetical protein Aazo_1253 ['Nostoc azollae' 0708]|jgi:hypothetical protein|uniref:Uncharacterized protein n=1 Tax=Nostoc azollae (strain 0708) TaxID=551115 RepID=D7E3C6_NOSA0|nr:hypothetical protein Aazo_1253 ['Nostoc azollae' 0708]